MWLSKAICMGDSLGATHHHIRPKGFDKLRAGSHGSQVRRVTSHTRLRARDHCTSSSHIGGKRGASPSLLHTMLEGAMEYVNAR